MISAPAPHDPGEVYDLQWGGIEGHTGWDVGANVGQSVEEMTSRFEEVVSFEPAVESYRLLYDHWHGCPGVTLLNLALSSGPGMVALSVREAPIQTGQLVSVGMPYHGEDFGRNTANWGEEEGQREVPCATADMMATQIGRPDFIKIDTEGHELEVLRGARDLLASGHPTWLIEFHTYNLQVSCQELLAAAGYEVQVIRHPHYDPDSVMWKQHGWMRADSLR